jgi:subtilase family serine protease
MKKRFYKFAVGVATVSLVTVGAIQGISGASGGGPLRINFGPAPVLQGAGPWQIDNNLATVTRACPTATANEASCDALVLGIDRTSGQSPFGNLGQIFAKNQDVVDTFADNYTALSPAQIISAYNFPTTSSTGALPGTGKTIAIIDAYDDPNIVSDLSTFNSQFGIPQLNSCTITTTSGPCFQKVSETGTTAYPAFNQSWAEEISLDVEWAHAIAPGASILLVEANTSNMSDLAKSIEYASTKAQYISMSFGVSESSTEKTDDLFFTSSTASYFAAAGDSGVGAQWPSTSPKAISVGGTTLNLSATGAITSETGWVSGGGGCSEYETATAAQASYPTYGQSGCNGFKATPDVAADADPNSGVFVYDSNGYAGTTGWYTVGGTSLATPIWAARAANSGVTVNSAYIYGTNSIKFDDITQGGNANGCLVGYDMCSGLGSWNN